MKSFSPWRANAAVCAPAFIKARIIGQSLFCNGQWCDLSVLPRDACGAISIAVCLRSDHLRKEKYESAGLSRLK
jgi:hypothetical protein